MSYTHTDQPGREQAADEAVTLCVALGIPQGLIADPQSRSLAGAVRRGGELVSLTQADYDLWSALITPMTRATFDEMAAERGWSDAARSLERLMDRDLVIEFELGQWSGEPLARVRPIPRGVGIGNLNSDEGVYQIDGSSSPALSVDAVAFMLWWEFDGATSLASGVEKVIPRLPDLRREAAQALAVALVCRLLAHRLIHLDAMYAA